MKDELHSPRRRLVDKLPEVPDSDGLRFRQLYQIDDVTDCWVWTGAVSHDRGQFRANGRSAQADRWAWEREHGPLPSSMWLKHECASNMCVNPAHLRRVEPRVIAGSHERLKTHCPAGHPYDERNTYVTPKGKRMCRACRRQFDRVKRKR